MKYLTILLLSGSLLTGSLAAFKPASGLSVDPSTMTEVFGAGPTHHQSVDVVATGSASIAQVNAVPGLRVNYLWQGFTNIANTTGVSNYLHFTGATAADNRSIRLTTRYNSTNQSNWAGVGSTGAAPDGVMRVSGDFAWYLGSIGGSWTSAEIAFGRLSQTGDDPEGTRNDSFSMDAGSGLTFGVQSVGFIISNVYENQSFSATLYDWQDNVISTLTGMGSATGVVGAGDEVFFGYIGDANFASWVSRVVVTGNNAGRNTGLDNLAFSPITAIPEPQTYALVFGVLGLAFVLWRRRR